MEPLSKKQLDDIFKHHPCTEACPKASHEEVLKMKQDPKHEVFVKWLKENGAIFDKIEYPAIFEGGLMGIAAKQDIP